MPPARPSLFKQAPTDGGVRSAWRRREWKAAPQEWRRLGGLFSLAGARRELCFNASFNVRGL
jgi:hypothetical protein